MKGKDIFRILAIVLMLAAGVPCAQAQRHTVSGYMTDRESGEPLISAAAVEKGLGLGAVTNNFGFYSLTIPEGAISLEFSYVGYESERHSFRLTRDTVINVAFSPQNEALAGATVTASRSETGVRGTQMSAIEIPVNMIRNIPAIGGEVDIIKAIQLLPGVQSGTEGAAGLYVRGGGPDENLLLLDGVPLYNVNHMLGFFSVFDADAIKNVTLYKGSFPARFGSRLSSVLDVRMKDGNDQDYHGSFSVGLLSAKANVEGPIVKGKTSFCISARRTYYDVLAMPFIKMALKDDSGDTGSGGYYFYDLNAKVTHKFNNRDKLYLSFYSGDDKVYVDIKDVPYSGYGETTLTDIGWKWGNIVGAARWNHIFGPKLFMNATLSYTQYRHQLAFNEKSEITSELPVSESYELDMKYNSLINDISSECGFEYTPSSEHSIRFGANFTHHTFKPSVSTLTDTEIRIEGRQPIESKTDTVFGDRNLFSREAALYGEDNWSVSDRFKVNFGLRGSLYSVDGTVYRSLEPRVSLRFLATDGLSFKAAYSEMSQYVHLLSNSTISLPTDLWVPVTSRITPMRSQQAAAGAFWSWKTFDFSIEGYYKTMNNVLEYKDGSSFLSSVSGWEDKVASGRGWSYGVELLAQRKTGRTTGWIGYTWSKSMRQFDREGGIINSGKPFPAKYDRRHDLDIVVNHQFNKKIDISGTFVFSTGNCGSLAMQFVDSPHYDRYHNYSGTFSRFSGVEALESRNNYRMPDYCRVDLGVNFHKQKKHCERIFNISVYNALNRRNPFLVYRGSSDLTGKPALIKLSIFPIMPSFSLTYKF